jgi:PHP family Zn ribbon phosphoesterase
MSPPAIVRAASRAGLNLIAICDHNAAANAAAVQQAAVGVVGAPVVIAGMEITTAEEIHILGLFPSAEAALAVEAAVQATLPRADRSYYRRFGRQELMDAAGAVIGLCPAMLAASTSFDLPAAIALVKRHDGLAVACHVDRPSFSVTSQLGFIPPDAGFDAIETSPQALEARIESFRSLRLPMIFSSDSHYPSQIGGVKMAMAIDEPSFDEVRRAFEEGPSRA